MNRNYLKSAISKLYGDDDDFIVIGLTGQTGSGCSTAARILQSERTDIKHSLFNGDAPKSNEHRKERIIFRYFHETWKPFYLLQVRSLITSFLLDDPEEEKLDQLLKEPLEGKKLDQLLKGSSEKEKFDQLLKESLKDNQLIKNLKKSLEEEGFYQKLENPLLEDKEKELVKAIIKALAKEHSQYKIQDGNDDWDKEKIKYYTDTLQKKCDFVKILLGESSFVKLYQKIGQNIRLSGNPYNENHEEGKFFTLAERINKVVKSIHSHQQSINNSTLIVIDAIRNPLEAIFFQDRYSSFFLAAISTIEKDRVGRLRKLGYSEKDIKSIDEEECKSYNLDKSEFYSVQNIPACLQRADLYISNPDVTAQVDQYQNLANQIIRFVSLIRRPGIITPSAVERCMQIAYTAKLNSGCISRQVGAVVTDKNYSIRSIGWNDVPYGQVSCNLRSRDDLLRGLDSEAYSEFERNDQSYLEHFKESSKKFEDQQIVKDLKGRNKAFCFKSEYNDLKKDKNQVHTRSLHAEENAFLQISKYGLASIENGVLFTTASPCELCAKKAYQLGISKIYYIDPYPGIALTHILQGGSNNPSLLLFSGAIGRAFHKLYSPIVPYKDELNAFLPKEQK